MNPIWLIAIPLVLVILGMILNNIGLGFDQPESSREQDAAKRAVAEREAYRKFFDLQRSRSLKRQRRVGQYSWLVLLAFVVSFVWLYFDTLNKTTAAKQIAAIQTLPTTEGKDVVLSVTLRDGNNAKYLIKLANGGSSDGSAKAGILEKAVSSWEVSRSETALSIGKNTLPLGIAVKISN